MEIIVAANPIKLSLGISVLAHGLIIGGVAWLGLFHRSDATAEVGNLTTLELIAAPVSAPEQTAEPVVAPPLPAPAPPPKEIIPSQPTAPPPVADDPIPVPAPPVESTPETIPVPSPIVPVAAPRIPVTASVVPGDNSSPLPGKDATTIVSSPIATVKPNYLKNLEREYPLAARRRGQQGTVLLNVTVNAMGHVTEISLKESSGFELLDQAALRAVRMWEFEPARVGSQRVESRLEVPVRFKLTN